jgi:signal transduction histidine kinase
MTEHANTFLLVTILLFVTILLIFGMKYFSAARQVHARVSTDTAFRDLAEKATALQSEAVAALASVRAELADIKLRLASVEKILKEVE